MSSCCWNPVVYYWTNDTLRAGFTYAVGSWCPSCALIARAIMVRPPVCVWGACCVWMGSWCRCVRRPTTVPVTACRRQVVYQSTLIVYQSTLRDSELHADAAQRGPATGVSAPRQSSSLLYYRARRLHDNDAQQQQQQQHQQRGGGVTDNIELRQMRASSSAGCSAHTSPFMRADAAPPRSC